MFRVLTDPRVLASTVLVGGLLTVAVWPRPVTVEVARVARGPLVLTIDEEGRTRVRDRFLIAAPVTGHLFRIEHEPGDRVSRGDVVARLQSAAPGLLDDRAYGEALAALRRAEAALGHARADEARARAALEHLQRELRRTQHLRQAGATTIEALETREAEATLAQHEVNAAAFAVRAASADVERVKRRAAMFSSGAEGRIVSVTAPTDGVVLQRFRQSEGLATAGAPLLEIGDVQRLEIVADVRSSDAVLVRPGSAATVEQWGGDVPFTATVRRIEPAGFTRVSALGVEEQRVNVILDFDVNEAGEEYAPLGDRYRVEARIILANAGDVLKVPTSALMRDGRGWAVYVVTKGRARRTLVELGPHTGQEAQVMAGLSEGAMVVVYPNDLMHDGVRIVDRVDR